MTQENRMSDAQIIQDIRAYVQDLVQKDEFSGAVLVAKAGEVLFKGAYGLASRRYQVSNRVDTRFNLGSMNKMFTGVAVVQLAEHGKLEFGDKVGKHLPDFPIKDVIEKVTIHQLLTHTSGMGSHFNTDFQMAAKERFRQLDDYLPLIIQEPLAYEPGQRWQYSNSGFLLLGMLVEKISGQNYFDYVREHIYLPAGMLNTDAYDMDDDDVQNLAMGYTLAGPGGKRLNNIFMHAFKGGPAGGGFSTVEDLLRFDQALRSHILLGAQYTQTLLKGKVKTGRSNEDLYAYGFGEQTMFGTRVVGHGGGFPGINSQLHMYLDLDYTVAVMANYDPPAAERVAARLHRRLTGTPLPVAIGLDEKTLHTYAGKYVLQMGEMSMPIRVLAEGQHLLVRMMMGQRHYYPLTEETFFDEETNNELLVFEKDQHGKVQSLVLWMGEDLRAKKVE